jgi:hypothetical protein
MNTKETMNILNNLLVNDKLTVDERYAINEACNYISQLEYNNKEQTDFQGWPLEKLTMKELRKFVRDNCALDDNVKLRILQDDGMGYGANNGYCTDISIYEDMDNNNKEVQFWF